MHGHQTDRSIEIGLSLKDLELSGIPFFTPEMSVRFRFGLRSSSDVEPHVLGVTLADDREVSFKFDKDLGQLRLADATSSAVLVDRFIELLRRVSENQRLPFKLPNDADRRWLREWARKHGCRLHGWLPFWVPAEYGAGKMGRPFGGRLESDRNQQLQIFLWWWQQWVFHFTTQFSDFLEGIVYVGPLRDFPRRVAAEASEDAGLGTRGERLVLYLGRRPDLVDAINEAFKDLEIDYKLSVERISSERMQDALGDVAFAVLRDNKSGVDLSPTDVGFGLSQVLPVVVQLLGNRERLILIEQPEIHLHPRMQSRLTDILVSSVAHNGNQLLIETHSEHLALRAQRRIREKVIGLDELGISYVGVGSEGSFVKEIELSADGQMLTPWPGGFFDEKFDDLFVNATNV